VAAKPSPAQTAEGVVQTSVERSFDRDTADTAKALREQQKVKIRLYQVPPDSTDRPLPDEFVQINGHGYLIQRGVSVEVPEGVATVLEQAGRL
jgi:hypothetical protein